MHRAESSRQHVRALNNQFASWVNTQLQIHHNELWEDGVRDYITHASSILEEFSDVVNRLKSNSNSTKSFRPSWSTSPLFNNNTSFSIGGQNSISLKTDASNDVDGESIKEGIKLADEIGYPVMIKATAGGGGLGMRLAKEHDEFVKLLQQPQSEAAAAFGIDGVYLEKYIQNRRHIEFQMKLKA
ncbi:hypothetical protein L2E82_40231 [Cichorium intybus]|uniref:Uncharacterized protein n=1 Tax=Cichorium intybus TaxID=13427 RepID=A0ACB9AK77_CICIN|nr:hypothetical protein L2E82_40231 [Cichorium intybus]